jgi:CDP-diacylglycerol--serine O-phosphatidyltransferase
VKKIKQYIPNLLTCCNLMAGFYACIQALSGNCETALVAVLIAAGFDFLDGLVARILHAFSPIGKDLDSLADMVSFGIAPGMMVFNFLDCMQKTVDWTYPIYGKLFLIAAFAIPVFSALRLAKFNNDERQHVSFIGLPVPAHAILWMSLIYTLAPLESKFHWDGWIVSQSAIASFTTALPPVCTLVGIALLAVGTSLLLISTIPMFSLKTTSLAWKGNECRYILLIVAVACTGCAGVAGITATILLYIIFSIFNKQP